MPDSQGRPAGTILAFDFGVKRIGVAVGEWPMAQAHPLTTIRGEANAERFAAIEALIKEQGIQEKVIFYGVEDIVTRNPIWGVFSLIKRISPNFVQFSKLPPSRLQGIVTRVEM